MACNNHWKTSLCFGLLQIEICSKFDVCMQPGTVNDAGGCTCVCVCEMGREGEEDREALLCSCARSLVAGTPPLSTPDSVVWTRRLLCK